MARPTAVEVKGLREFRRELAQLDTDLPDLVREIDRAIAERAVTDAQDSLKSSGHPVLRHVAELGGTSIKAAANGRRASVKLSARSKKNRPVLGAEFGSKRWSQFPAYTEAAWRDGIPTGGYGLHDAIRTHVTDYRDRYGDALDALSRLAFPD